MSGFSAENALDSVKTEAAAWGTGLYAPDLRQQVFGRAPVAHRGERNSPALERPDLVADSMEEFTALLNHSVIEEE